MLFHIILSSKAKHYVDCFLLKFHYENITLVRSYIYSKSNISECAITLYEKNGRMIRDFTFFLTVFQSNQDDERLIVKNFVKWNPVTVKKISPRAGLELWTGRSDGQR